jgi:segregation and condensation protein A
VSEPIETELAARPDAPEAAVGEQQELPLAFVHGKPLTVLPRDLYIPPEALEVFLEAFEGPLDLLLYLIRRQNLDILEINVAQITEQYMQYVELMDAMQFELAAEYLVMSAMLAEIKSRMLLPRQQSAAEEEADPRADLIRRLQEYEQFKQAAEDMDALPRLERDVFLAAAEPPELRRERPQPQVELRELLLAFAEVARRAALNVSHHVQMERLSTRERMAEILDRLKTPQFVPFASLFRVEEGRMGVVVTFLAIMELIKESLIEMVQSEPFGPIHVKPRGQDAVEVDH